MDSSDIQIHKRTSKKYIYAEQDNEYKTEVAVTFWVGVKRKNK